MATIEFVWDELDDNVEFEVDENGSFVATYLNQPGKFGEPLSQTRNGTKSFFNYDAESSTRSLTDDNENPTDTFTYSAFGESTARSGTIVTPFQYKGRAGYYTNPDTDDLYVRARTYSRLTGRWLSKDPIGITDGANLYLGYFVPLGVDPSGLELLYGGLRAFHEHQSKGDCGQATYTIRWEADPLLKTDNDPKKFCFVIQHVKTTVNVFDCKTGEWKKRTLASNCRFVQGETKNGFLEEMWEAWVVENDKVFGFDFLSPIPKPREGVGNDTYEVLSEGQDTLGTIIITGRAKIVCLDGPIANIHAWFKNWDRCGDRISGVLPSTTVPPTGWNDHDTITHDLGISWNCCCGQNWSELETSLTKFD